MGRASERAREGVRSTATHRFANAALAGQDEYYVLHVRESMGDGGEVGVGACGLAGAYLLVRAPVAGAGFPGFL